jgi:hypothetical protein
VLAVFAGVGFWPTATEAYPPRAPQPEPALVNIVTGGPNIQVPVLGKYLITIKPVPLNTEITAANEAEYFGSFEVAPATANAVGALTSADALHGKYAQRGLAANLLVTPDLFGSASIAPPPRVAPPPAQVRVNVHTASGTTEYVYVKTADGYRLVSPNPRSSAPPTGGAQ